jgi:murein DD-endopeptidase MepM/ murein hydrolase activator NlpD
MRGIWNGPAAVALLLLLAACAVSPPAAPPEPQSALETGRTYTSWFYSGELERLWSRLSPEMRQVFGTPADLRSFRGQVQADAGAERAVVEEQVIRSVGAEVYNRTAAFTTFAQPLWIQWTLDPGGVVLGLLVKPAPAPAASRFLEYRTRTALRLPFSGEWFVTWGERSVLENYHAETPDQRFAYDFLVVREGRTHAGDPARNESYFCWGLPVLAPGSGIVASAADTVADNVPGRMNARQPLGNQVILDHGDGEFSFLVHLQRGSVRVRQGQRVEAGEVLGSCGNSGHSTEPHLHYHLQTTAEFQAGEGLPAQFLGYRADGARVARGEPTRGQVVAP